MRGLIIAPLLLALVLGDNASPLPSLNVDPTQTSVSGLSSGGFFAVQFQVAFSSIIKGAGIFAGGPWDCAQGSLTTALNTCMNAILGAPDADKLADLTRDGAKAGDLDDVDNMNNHRVFMFSGTQDTTVKPVVMSSLLSYYKHFIPASQIVFDSTTRAAHTQPTDDPANKNACTTSSSPYLSNCNYDGAGKALQQIFNGQLNARNTGTLSGTLSAFDQSEFGGDALASTGYVYVPKSCADGAACKVHVSFHGCTQTYAKVGDAYVAHAGYNKWADTNNMIVLYPQVSTSATNQCWNWWGYDSDTHYDDKKGSQMGAVKKMIDRLASGQKPPIPAPSNLRATASSDSSISLAWDSVSGADGYHVYRDNVLVSGETAITSTSYTDSGLSSGTTFSYTVAGVSGKSSEGSRSSAIAAKTTGNPPPIQPPQGLQVTGETDATVSLSWTGVAGAQGYTVYRDGKKDTPQLLTATTYTDAGLTPETAYQFAVSATAQDGTESALSSTVSATTQSSWKCKEFTDSNYAHVSAGRAHDQSGLAYANGSNDSMGLDNIFYKSTLAETKDGFYVVGSCSSAHKEYIVEIGV